MDNRDDQFYSLSFSLVDWNEVLNNLGKVIDKKTQKEEITIDQLLDQYNDYMTLYNMFRDDEYKIQADDVLEQLRELN